MVSDELHLRARATPAGAPFISCTRDAPALLAAPLLGERLNQHAALHVETDDVDPRVRVRFSDTGDGIPEENRERIFDAFFTTRTAPPAGASDTERASGSGLGLWIVSQIASNAGGEVSLAEPPPGLSTCFEVLLPPEEDNVE